MMEEVKARVETKNFNPTRGFYSPWPPAVRATSKDFFGLPAKKVFLPSISCQPDILFFGFLSGNSIESIAKIIADPVFSSAETLYTWLSVLSGQSLWVN